MQTIIESVAKGLAFQDAVGEGSVTLDLAIGDLHCCLDRVPTEDEKRLMISRYGHHLRQFKSRGDQ